MRVRAWLFSRETRRAIAALGNEHKIDKGLVASGAADWRSWWEQHGERELRCILMTAWDPVRSGEAPEAWDEYDDYLAGVAHRLRETEDTDETAGAVAAFLDHIERDFMSGLTPAAARRNRILADQLVAWHEWSFVRRGRPPGEWIDED